MKFFSLLALSVLFLSAGQAGTRESLPARLAPASAERADKHGRPESIDWNRVHDLTMHGINHLYSLEVDDAMRAFDSVSRMAPGDPRGPFFQSMVHFYLYGLNRDEKELTTFLEESERVIEICERLLDQNEQDATTKFYLGGIYGYRGLAYHGSGSYLKAARDGRKGYLLLEEAVKGNPELYDAHMGFGLFRYLLAKLPKSMRWILSMLGFSGDLEGGLNSLRLAAEKGLYTRTEAKLSLAQFLFSEGRQDTALRYLNKLRKEYPENTLFVVLYAFWQHRLHNLEEAMAAARAAIELNSRKKIRHGEELAYSTLGSIYFTLNDFSNASTYYRLYMKLTHTHERTPNLTYLRAGVACEIAGDRATALDFYRRMKEVNDRDRAWETYNYRRAQERIRHPLTEADILIVKAENEFTQKRYVRAIELYSEGFQKTNSDVDLQARTLYGIQQAQFEAEMFADAVETANRLLAPISSGLALKPVDETWIIPHAWFKLGQTYAKLGKAADARHAFDRMGEYDDYDFQERLEERVKEEMKKLEQVN
ncbi:MAG: tetratricopeptide repeat protein [Bacteroidota bacterium]